jgi:hypothetical protein
MEIAETSSHIPAEHDPAGFFMNSSDYKIKAPNEFGANSWRFSHMSSFEAQSIIPRAGQRWLLPIRVFLYSALKKYFDSSRNQ